jgi:hypothetical protein
MAVLSRINWQSQQRVDLSHLLGEQSFAAYDWRAGLKMFNGIKKNFVVKGLEVNGVSGLSVSVAVADCFLCLPLDGSAAFFNAASDDPDQQIIVPPALDNIYVEAYIERDTQTPVTTAFFDPGATSQTNPAGSEFTASTDFFQVIELKFRFKTDGFSVDALPVCRLKTSSTQIVEVTDARNMFFRLGTGGGAPNPFYKFAWSNLREETSNPGISTAIGQFNSGNPYFVADANGAKNDKALDNMKDWMDAVMTIIAEMKGTPTWYFPTVGKTIPNLLFLTGNATSIVPVPNRTVQWSRDNDEKLRSKGTGEPTSWAMNFGSVRWYLGGSFVSGTTRRYASKDWEITVNENEAFFLFLDREKLPPGVPASSVKWGLEFISSNPLVTAIPVTQQVKGQEGDFTGVAIGDYIRKEGGEYYEYYRVIGVVESGVPSTWDPLTQDIDDAPWGQIATSGCTGVILDRDVDGTSTEPYRWFRSAYSQEDMFKTLSTNSFKVQSNSGSPLVIDIDDINLYWLGRRSSPLGSEIVLFRDYGNVSPGEEFAVLEDSDGSIKSIGSHVASLIDTGTAITSGGVVSSLGSEILTLSKRKTDNLVNTGLNNVNAAQSYVIPEPSALTFSADGDGLWVRLDDAQVGVGTLIAGTVNPSEPTVPVTNVFEILPISQNPLRNFRNKDVYLVCRRVTINGVVSLQFQDGTILQADGIGLQKDITKVVSGVTTSTTVTTPIVHGFLRNTAGFVWSARRTSTGRAVGIAATHSATGLTLDETPGGVENLTVVFSRHVP